MDHYVAYHSAKIMGRPYRARRTFNFNSGKSESQLRKAIGHSTWVIASQLGRRNQPEYFLAGVYVPTRVSHDSEGWLVSGSGVPFQPAIVVTNLEWFKALRLEQNNFSYGFNRIRSASIVTALERYRNSSALEPQSAEKGSGGALLDRAIYVNCSEVRLRRGAEMGEVLEDRKRWVSGERLWREAGASGKSLPLIFAQYRELMYWSVATRIDLSAESTTYGVSELIPIFGRQRRDLVLSDSGKRLSNAFIRSYAVVRTPTFLVAGPEQQPLSQQSIDELGAPYALEGEERRVFIVHRTRERRLRDAKIAAGLSQNGGRLVCEVPGCGFDFHATYGEMGKGYAHVHHLLPFAGVAQEGRSNGLDDLAIVCANCHAMIHSGGKCRPISELASALQKLVSP